MSLKNLSHFTELMLRSFFLEKKFASFLLPAGLKKLKQALRLKKVLRSHCLYIKITANTRTKRLMLESKSWSKYHLLQSKTTPLFNQW